MPRNWCNPLSDQTNLLFQYVTDCVACFKYYCTAKMKLFFAYFQKFLKNYFKSVMIVSSETLAAQAFQR